MRASTVVAASVIAVVVATSAGCAAYRVSSNIESAPSPSTPPTAQVLVLTINDSLPDRRYTEIGPIEVSVKKLTAFHQDPTRGQANAALIEKAREMGADAVIYVRYASGVGFFTWGYIDAKGTAVKFAD